MKVEKIVLDGYISRDCLLFVNEKTFQVKFCIKNKDNKWVAAIVPAYDSLTWYKMRNKYQRKGQRDAI